MAQTTPTTPTTTISPKISASTRPQADDDVAEEDEDDFKLCHHDLMIRDEARGPRQRQDNTFLFIAGATPRNRNKHCSAEEARLPHT